MLLFRRQNAACFVALLCGGPCLYAQTTAPPVYAGKTAAQWAVVLTDHLQGDSDEDKEACREAAAALGQIGLPAKEAVGVLSDAIQSPSLEVRSFAVDALGRIGPPAIAAVPAIVQEMDLTKDHVNYTPLAKFRQLAARTLGRIGPEAKEAVPALGRALKNEDPVYRIQAALALWRILKMPRAIEFLASMLSQTDSVGPYEAAMALGEIGPDAIVVQSQLIDALDHPQVDVRRACADVLARLGPTVIEPVAKRIQEGKLKSPVDAAYVLGAVIAPLRRDVFYATGMEPADFDAQASPVLQFAIPSLIALLSDSRDFVRQAAQRALSQAGMLAIPPLLEVIRSEDSERQQSAIETLVRIEAFLPLAGSDNQQLTALRNSVLDRLTGLMDHKDARVRGAVFRTFAETSFGDQGREALPLLHRALKDENLAVRRYASQAIRNLSGD